MAILSRRILLEAIILVAFGCLVGLSLNYRLVIDAFSGRLAPPERVAVDDRPLADLPVPVMLEDLEPLVAAGALVVDARAPELYAEGHIPGARSLPLVEVDDVLPEFREEVPPQKTLILYCSGFGCPDSFDLGLRLIEAGYTDVRVFEGGFPEWRDSGRPIAEGAG